MPAIITKGAMTAQGYGFAAPSTAANYIEDVFSTYLYTGTGAVLTVTNGIDLSGKGGLVWVKQRSNNASQVQHYWVDTARGTADGYISSNNTNATNAYDIINSFNSNGFGWNPVINDSGYTYASWTFRKQAKFFDVVTWTGDGTNNRAISHNLGSNPGCILIKSTSNVSNWNVYHSSIPTDILFLERTDAATAGGVYYVQSTSSTTFTIGRPAGGNANGYTYVAYLFASNAGGFGNAGADNVITCGSFTVPSSGTWTDVNLGYEPQWILVKSATGTRLTNWQIIDNMRGWTAPTSSGYPVTNWLGANLANSESDNSTLILTSTGFQYSNTSYGSGNTFIYIAIRRGPMATPTVGTSVFSPVAYAGANAGTSYTTNFPVDLTWTGKTSNTASHESWDRLRGEYPYLLTDSTAAEGTAFGTTNQWLVDNMTGVKWNIGDGYTNTTPGNYITWNFRRAPGFFDEVCYTGTGTGGQTYTHNLGVVPELMIIKSRSASRAWQVYSANLTTAYYLILNSTNAQVADGGGGDWYGTAPTSTVFSVGTNFTVNNSGETYVAYLFATCAGVSKVGSYTGNGTTQTINCGFGAGGARFVLIKRTDSTGDWYVYDTARGMTTLTDPYLLLNSTAAETATLGSVTTVSTGFALNSTILAAINVSGGSYIFFAVS